MWKWRLKRIWGKRINWNIENSWFNYFKSVSQEFRLKNIDETWNYFLEEIKQNGYQRGLASMVYKFFN